MNTTFTFKECFQGLQYSWMTGLPTAAAFIYDSNVIIKVDVAEYFRFYSFSANELPNQVSVFDVRYLTSDGTNSLPSIGSRGSNLIEKLQLRLSEFIAASFDGIEVTSIVASRSDMDGSPILINEIAFEETTPHFWSVRGHLVSGGVETFFDFHNPNDAIYAAEAIDTHLKTKLGILIAEAKPSLRYENRSIS